MFDFLNYVVMNFYILNFTKFEKHDLTHFIKDFHVMKKLKIKVLIDMNILKLENINVFHNKR